MPNTINQDITRDSGQKLEFKRQLIRNHLLKSYNSILNLSKINLTDNNIESIINVHKKYINKTNIYGKNKYTTLRLLEQYKRSKNKSMGMMILTNSLNKLSLFCEI